MSEAVANNDIISATARPLPAVANPVGGALQSLRTLTAQPAVAKSLPMIGLIAMLGLAAMIWMAFSAPPQRNLFNGLPDADKAAVADALQAAGLDYMIDRSTGALSVSEADYHQAKILLASQGLPKSAPDGNALLNDMPLGSSRAVEGEKLRNARETELARTIEAIDAVQTAKVHLAVEAPSVFLRDRSEPAASVMLRLASGRALSAAQVSAIVHLVASSVPGLAPDGVSVVDQNGRLLSSAGGNGVAETSDKQVAVQARIEDRYRQNIVALLTPIVGADNFTTEVHADLDFSEVHATREGFPKEAATLRTEQGGWTADAAAQSAGGGIPGALANTPPPASEVAAAPGGVITPATPGAVDSAATAAGKTTENYTRSFAVGREVSVTRQQPGTVKRLSVAVALKNPEGGQARSKEELAALEALVKGAIGFDAERGDVVALSARAFAPIEETSETWYEAGWLAMLARNLTALAIAALIVFGVAKPLLKNGGSLLARRPAAAPGQVGNEIAAALADQQRKSQDMTVTLAMIEGAGSYETRAELIRNFVRQDPARAALVVRDLIRAGNPGSDKNG